MSGQEISPNSPTSITLTKSQDAIKVTLTLELSAPKDMEIALDLLEKIKQNLIYSHLDSTSSLKRDNLPQYIYQMDLPQSLRHKLIERAIEENCSAHTLCVHWLSRLCERGDLCGGK